MMNAFLWSCLVCFLIGGGTSDSDPEEPVEVSAVLGGEVTFPVRISKGFEIEKIICLFERYLIAEMTPGKNYTVEESAFSGRLHAVDAHGSLKITNLRTEDCGVYTVQIFGKKDTARKERKRYELQIFSRVKPTVISRVIERANGSCLIAFNCTVSDHTSVSYSWSGEEVGQSEGPVVSLNLTESASNLTVCCTVKNPASNASACVFPREHCFPESASAAPSCTCGYLLRISVCASSAVICALVGVIVYRLQQRTENNLRDKQNSKSGFPTPNNQRRTTGGLKDNQLAG